MSQGTAVQLKKEETPVKFVPFDRLAERINKLYDQIACRAFAIFEGNGRKFGRELDDWFKAESELLHPVLVDFKETDEAFQVKAEVPGFAAKELEISAEPRRLTVVGKKESKEEKKTGKTVYSEINSNQIFRVVEFPADVNTDKISATLKDGVLEVTLPKAVATKKVRVEPKAA
jgi:HSP20 family protein